VTEKLKEIPKGASISYMDCGTPVCGLFWQALAPAAKTMGVNVERVKAGSAANTVSAAFDSVIAKKPDAVIVTAINVELWKNQLEQLQEAEIPVVTTGITGTEPYGIESPQAAEALSVLTGKQLANYVVAEMNPQANAVIYEVPELPFAKIVAEKFSEELESICAECSARTVPIPVAEIGTTAPSTVVSDLQANPETNVAVFTADELELGLPAALQAAGIEVETLGYSPGPQNLEYIKEGKETAGFAVDLPVLSWTLLDQAAREIVGQKLTGPEGEGITDMQFLTQKDIAFDPAKGWTGYPEFAERFAKLWGVGG
jgi:ribose transport system substrate-binding protein